MIELGDANAVVIEGINNASFRSNICEQLAKLLEYKNAEEITGFKLENGFGSVIVEPEIEKIVMNGKKFGTGFVLTFREKSGDLILKIRLIKTRHGPFIFGDVLEPQGIWEVRQETGDSVSQILGIHSVQEDRQKDLECRYKQSWEILHDRKYK